MAVMKYWGEGIVSDGTTKNQCPFPIDQVIQTHLLSQYRIREYYMTRVSGRLITSVKCTVIEENKPVSFIYNF